MKSLMALLMAALVGPLAGVQDQTGVARPSSADWMSEDGGVLELKLAHEEKARPDGGTLRIDSRRRTVLFEGIPGEFGCKLKVEASFDDIKDITVSELAGFVLELKTGKNKKLVLIPVPHAWWFVHQWKTQGGNFAQTIPEGALRDHDGAGLGVTGAEGGAGPRLKHRDIPEEVVKDTRKAANAIRLELGRNLLR